jgi:hypothetical protein
MRIRNVVLANMVPMSSGYQSPKDLTGPDWEVDILEFPWVLIRHRGSKRTGVTTIFNVVGRASEDSDMEQLAKATEAAKPVAKAAK